MSDGMSDARASEGLYNGFWTAAFDLKQAAIVYARAVMRARIGHRGWGIARWSIVNEVNDVLIETGFKLVDTNPDKSFESYADAYKPPKSWRELELERENNELREKLQRLERALI